MGYKYNPTEEEKQIIRDLYDGSSLRLSKIMRLLDSKYPRWFVRRLARDMGLARTMPRDWTEEEERYLDENWPAMGLKYLQRGLKRTFGVQRSYTAIHLKIKRLALIKDQNEDGFTLRGLQSFLWGGQEQHHIIQRWIQKGWLRGKRRGTLRHKGNGGDMWYFSPEWVRSFIIQHPEEIDLRLVDGPAFIGFLAGDSEVLALCRCPLCESEFEKKLFNPGVKVLRIFCDRCRLSVGEVAT